MTDTRRNSFARAYIAKQKIPYSNFIFNGCFSFTHRDKNLLLSPDTGTTIIVDNTLANNIKNCLFDDSLLLKLIQRRFVTNTNDHDVHSIHHDLFPTFFLIDITSSCNFSCTYCFRKRNDDEILISDSVLDDICEFIKLHCNTNDLRHIDIQPWGGEPLLALNKIERIYNAFSGTDINIHISLETNGSLLTEKTLRALAAMRVSVGISIDGPPEVQDSQRCFKNGDPSSSVLEKNISRLHAIKGLQNVNAICVLTPESSLHVDEILEYFGRKLRIPHVKVNFAHSSNFSPYEGLSTTSAAIETPLRDILLSIRRLYKEDIVINEGNISQRLKNLLLRDSSSICISRGCVGGYKMVSFDRWGNIFPCELLDYPDEKIGNIYDGKPLGAIVQDAVKTHRYFIPKTSPSCLDCPWRYYCQGGCTSALTYAGKHPPQIDDAQCLINNFLYPELIKMCLSEPDLVNAMLEMDILQ